MVKDGMTARSIAEATGISKSVVGRIRQDAVREGMLDSWAVPVPCSPIGSCGTGTRDMSKQDARPTIMALAITSGHLDAFNAIYTRRRGCSGMRLMRLWDKAYQCE